ncbi:hypothetical protein Glove_139g276 [Diversispora epigaea]|uniref:Protein kinase domain-containing protein n=1 Tax=Diversispora epigaea TaxID=1348612 RepID=A0A397J4V9_9GLOM|nr:hypothetical protein Glove_139g276 [Diversispora epigaea]
MLRIIGKVFSSISICFYAWEFKEIHKLDIIHHFHPRNLLSHFGLSKLIVKNVKRNVFGVLPYIALEVLGGEEYTKASDVYSFAIVAYEIITGIQPYSDVPHDNDLALKICNGLRPKIPFHAPKLITQMIMRSEELSAIQTTTTTPLNYKTHPQAIYTSRLLNYSNIPEPKNEENFEKEFEELTESLSHINTNYDVENF